MRVFVARITAAVDPGMQNTALPSIVPATDRDNIADVPISS